MWQTPIGDRALKGAEARVVRASLRSVLRIIDDHPDGFDDIPMFGVPLFDQLEKAQRLVLLADIAAALFREEVPPMRLTAVVEAAVFTLYVNVMNEIEYEIELQGEVRLAPRRRWRRRVLAACREIRCEAPACEHFEDAYERIKPPAASCADITAWNDEVSALVDRLLGDRDWEMADELLDQPPEVAKHLKANLGIEDDYFTAVVPLPKASEIIRSRLLLRDLVRARPK